MGFFDKTPQIAQNSALKQMGQLMQGMQNPQQMMLNMIMQQNPQMKQVLGMLQDKSPQQIESAVKQLFQQNGVDINQFMPQAQAMLKQFGVK